MEELKRVRMQMLDDGTIKITGINHLGYKVTVIVDKNMHIRDVDSYSFQAIDYNKFLENYRIRYKNLDWSKPMIPTRLLPKVHRRKTLWYAIYDLLAESSLYAFGLSDNLDLLALEEYYGSVMYEGVEMDVVAGNVIKAIRKGGQ